MKGESMPTAYNVPEDIALPGDRIGDLDMRESRTNRDARTIDAYVVKRGKPVDGLISLQGGALRGLYTSGVLDAFLDVGLAFKDVIGISAGALNAMNYVAGVRGASAFCNLTYAGDPRYMGMRDFLLKGRIFDFEFMFDEVFDHLVPFDYARFFDSPMGFTAVASNCLTGRPTYFERDGVEDVRTVIAASGSMPGLSRFTFVDGIPYLDGGITDPLGMGKAREAMAQGRKVVFVLTRERGFCKETTTKRMKRVWATTYPRYPKLVKRLCTMNELTDEQMLEADKMAAHGLAFVLHPIVPPVVTHTEKDTGKLRALYEQGIYETREQLDALLAYLER